MVRVGGAPCRTRDRSTRVKPFVSTWEPEISASPCDKCHRRSQPRLRLRPRDIGLGLVEKVLLNKHDGYTTLS